MRRVLVLIQARRLRRRGPAHAATQQKQPLKIRKSGADGRAFAANPLGDPPALTVARYSDFDPYFDMRFFSFIAASPARSSIDLLFLIIFRIARRTDFNDLAFF